MEEQIPKNVKSVVTVSEKMKKRFYKSTSFSGYVGEDDGRKHGKTGACTHISA